MKVKKILCCFLAAALISTCAVMGAVSVSATGTDGLTASQTVSDTGAFSAEYKNTQYYTRLQTALNETKDSSLMERTLAVALSQEGYNNYSTEGIDIESAKNDGLIWTGAVKRMSSDDTGNTEYTRWAEAYINGSTDSSIYYDMDWCAIFTSWCLYQAGYYSEAQLKKYYYSYCADPRIEEDADSWLTAFNMDQQLVWYTPTATKKIAAYPWNHYVHTEIDPYDVPYKPGGLLFFSWDGSGRYFNHVAIVKSYNKDTHVITYTNGNSGGQVITKTIDLDDTQYISSVSLQNSKRIMAYAEYNTISPLEEKIITAEQTEFIWDINNGYTVSVKTNSDSVIGSLSENGNYLGSNVESNMLLRYGEFIIGSSEIKKLGVGVHNLTLTFDDGALNFTVVCYDGSKYVSVNPSDITWDRAHDGNVTLNTDSDSDAVLISNNGQSVGTNQTEGVSFSGGKLTFSKAFLDSNLSDGDNTLDLIFPDGTAEVKFHVTSSASLVNNSTVNSDALSLGSRITFTGSADGGAGNYKYSYYYKRKDAKVWKTVGAEFTSATSAFFTPTSIGEIDIRIVVKDSNDNTEENSFTVKVVDGKSDAFRNTSTVNKTGAKPGTKIKLTASATGSSGYKYAFYYKRTTAKHWYVIGKEFTDTANAQFTPKQEGEFIVKVDVMDGNGEIVSRVLAVSISNDYSSDTTLINKSSVSADSVPVNTRIIITGSAIGGSAPYTYAYYYKKAYAKNWIPIGDEFTDATTAGIKLRNECDYIIKVCVKDADGAMVSSNYDVAVG